MTSARILAIASLLLAALVAPSSLPAQEQTAGQAGDLGALVDPATAPADPAATTDPAAPGGATDAADPSDPAATAPATEAGAAPTVRSSAIKATTSSVTIKDFSFGPASLTINVGDTVSWTNQGPTAHSATADDGSFDTGVYNAGQTRSHTFAAPGNFAYHCTPHPFMTASVRVLASNSSGADGGGSKPASGSGSSGSTSAPSAPSEQAATAAPDAAGSAAKSLPSTGSNTLALAIAGALLLAAGMLAARAGRRTPGA